ncbi:hypothetical protein [Flavivirga jejuensis]|uniref:Uncharacterized protein n=1 Tax=Flavivirga jejuensis TaxID=870487 RepID=A0ABT8WQR0_9FLAO|nr:hypothetical protein [Flavivirga jejuensis]MDO5975500.1 hypothetical protein [Flavivirga jejuensis]
MKRIFILLVLSLSIQYSFGQACGIYRIKYVGKINSESIKIEKIKLPTIEFLHGLEEENSEKGFIEIKPIENRIDIKLGSHLTSHLYKKSESLFKLYKAKRENIPIVITVIKNGKNKEIRIELTWDNIQISKIDDDKFGNLFELNLNEINIK